MWCCFEGCTKLKTAVLKCDYNPANNSFGVPAFTDAFKDCNSLWQYGIKVPAAQLEIYKNNASTMGVSADRFAAE